MRRDAFRAENARRWRPYGRVPGRHRSNVARGRSGTTPKVSRGRRADRRGVRAAPRTHLALGGMRAMWPIMGRLAAVILVRSACEHVRTPIARVFVSRGLWEVGGASRIEPGPGGPPEVAASAFAECEISMLGVLRPLILINSGHSPGRDLGSRETRQYHWGSHHLDVPFFVIIAPISLCQ